MGQGGGVRMDMISSVGQRVNMVPGVGLRVNI